MYNLTQSDTVTPPTSEDLQRFLQPLHLPTITAEQLTQLSAPYTTQEIQKAINTLPLHKVLMALETSITKSFLLIYLPIYVQPLITLPP